MADFDIKVGQRTLAYLHVCFHLLLGGTNVSNQIKFPCDGDVRELGIKLCPYLSENNSQFGAQFLRQNFRLHTEAVLVSAAMDSGPTFPV